MDMDILIYYKDYESIYIGAMGTWQIINFYTREGFFPIGELDDEYIVPLLEALNTESITVMDESGDIYIMPMHKYIGTGDIFVRCEFAIAPYVQQLENQITKSEDGNIRILVTDMAKAMRMIGLENSIYWGLKRVLFFYGIVVTSGQTKNHEPALVMRKRVEGDVLPESLTNIEN